MCIVFVCSQKILCDKLLAQGEKQSMGSSCWNIALPYIKPGSVTCELASQLFSATDAQP